MPEHVVIGGSDVLGRLSTGGMGEVLLARKRGAHGFEKLVALKTIRVDLARRTDIRRMFLDEARLMARLDHPAIAQVYDFGEDKEILYLAMEYVPGVALSKLQKQREISGRPIPAGVAARIVVEVCRGLHAAHELTGADGAPLGVVHRDISPHNLMLTFDGRVKILDFGIAWRKDREAPETEVGVIKGKISYIAPEQITGGKTDRRSDVYSAGVVLHELLSGRKLFAGQGVTLADTIARKKIPKPSELTDSIPATLDEVVLRALNVDPDRRFQDAREMAIALERCVQEIGGETVEEFAARELASERETHRARIQAITADETSAPRAQSGSGPAREESGSRPPSSGSQSPDGPAGERAASGGIAAPRDDARSSWDSLRELSLDPPPVLGSGTVADRPSAKSADSASGARSAAELLGVAPERSRPRRVGRLLAIAFVGAIAAVVFWPKPIDTGPTAMRVPERLPEPEPAATATRTALAVEETPPIPPTPQQLLIMGPTSTQALAATATRTETATAPEAAESETGEQGELEVEDDDEAEHEAEEEEAAEEAPPEPEPEPAPAIVDRPHPEPARSTARAPVKTAPAKPKPVAKARTTKPNKVVKRQPQRRPAKPQFGHLTIEANPRATVMIDGRIVGTTPINNLKLKPGRHDVQLRHPGSRVLRWKSWVTVQAGKKHKIRLR